MPVSQGTAFAALTIPKEINNNNKHIMVVVEKKVFIVAGYSKQQGCTPTAG